MRILISVLALLALWLPWGAAQAIDPADLLEPDKAFRFSARALDQATIEVRYRIAEGYYLYKGRFAFEVEPKTAGLGAAVFPEGLPHEDKFFGRQEIFRKDLRFTLPVKDAGSKRFRLTVTSQGCADVGVCYVPHRQSASIVLAGAGPAFVEGGSLRDRLERGSRPEGAPSAPAGFSLNASDTDVAALFETGGFWVVLASFFGFGLLLAFTPCVLPMIPILSGIVVGEGGSAGKMRALLLSLSYVLGMALAYAAAGVTASYTGTLLAAALQNVWVLTAFALVFVVLALSMFGLYELQMPGFLRDRLAGAGNRLTGGRFLSVTAMGALSAIIVSPCVAAPLAGALLYISQSRDVVLGGAALFVMALGMGVPLVAVAVSEGALLPRAGAWMNTVKRIFGVLLLAVAVWVVSPLIPVAAQMLAWSALLIVVAVLLGVFGVQPVGGGMGAVAARAMGIIALLAGVAMLAGVLSGSRDPLRPLDRLLGAQRESAAPLRFERVRTLAELEARVAGAGRTVMLDFYADWCVTCKEMERYTFTDAQVQQRLANVLLLQADVTANGIEDRELLKRFRLFGPPGMVFFDARGEEIRGLRVIGYQSPEQFLKSLDRLD